MSTPSFLPFDWDQPRPSRPRPSRIPLWLKVTLGIALLAAFGINAQNADMQPEVSDAEEEESELLHPHTEAAIEKVDDLAARETFGSTTPEGVSYLYGAGRAQIVCAVMRVCTIGLQPGEAPIENGLYLGDTTRWQVSSLQTPERWLIVLKPQDYGFSTNMVIHTTLRSYYVDVIATKEEYVPFTTFRYPDEHMVNATDTERRVSVGSLDFNYDIDYCDCPFNPERIWNDGAFTYIDFPEKYTGDAPVFVALDVDDDGMVRTAWPTDTRLVVEGIFEKSELRVGKRSVGLKWLSE